MDPTTDSAIGGAEACAQLAPGGVLKAAINLSNFLLVSGQDEGGAWRGVAPDMAASLARDLGVRLVLVPYPTPSEVADAVGSGAWSVAFIGNEPARAARIAFSPPYVEIEASYLVPPGSTLQSADEVDRPGRRIVAYRGSAFELWLKENLEHATLLHGEGFEGAYHRFRTEDIDAMASLRPKLLADVERWPGARILPGRFMSVQQSVGVDRSHVDAAAYVARFIARRKADGTIGRLIDQHRAAGLTASA